MTAGRFPESVVADAAPAWLESLGHIILHGPEIAPGEPLAQREDYSQVMLEGRLRPALQRLNPQAPPDALDEAFRRLACSATQVPFGDVPAPAMEAAPAGTGGQAAHGTQKAGHRTLQSGACGEGRIAEIGGISSCQHHSM